MNAIYYYIMNEIFPNTLQYTISKVMFVHLCCWSTMSWVFPVCFSLCGVEAASWRS